MIIATTGAGETKVFYRLFAGIVEADNYEYSIIRKPTRLREFINLYELSKVQKELLDYDNWKAKLKIGAPSKNDPMVQLRISVRRSVIEKWGGIEKLTQKITKSVNQQA